MDRRHVEPIPCRIRQLNGPRPFRALRFGTPRPPEYSWAQSLAQALRPERPRSGKIVRRKHSFACLFSAQMMLSFAGHDDFRRLTEARFYDCSPIPETACGRFHPRVAV